jgi:hypothetical protein
MGSVFRAVGQTTSDGPVTSLDRGDFLLNHSGVEMFQPDSGVEYRFLGRKRPFLALVGAGQTFSRPWHQRQNERDFPGEKILGDICAGFSRAAAPSSRIRATWLEPPGPGPLGTLTSVIGSYSDTYLPRLRQRQPGVADSPSFHSPECKGASIFSSLIVFPSAPSGRVRALPLVLQDKKVRPICLTRKSGRIGSC